MTYLNEFVKGYVECALWTGTNEAGDPLNEKFNMNDIDSDSLARMTEDCSKFYTDHLDMLTKAEDMGRDFEALGHDFNLSRNGHGTGFWDRDLGNIGETLHDAASKMGYQSLYIGDDGKLYTE